MGFSFELRDRVFKDALNTFLKYCLVDYLVLLQGCKAIVAGTLLFIAIPLLLGLLCDLIVIIPLRVPLDRHPVISLTTVSVVPKVGCYLNFLL